MLEHKNVHFLRGLLQFSQCVASTSTFSYELASEPQNLLPQNRCFVRGFGQLLSHLTQRHVCLGICTLSPLDAALTMRFAKNTQQDTLKCCACHETCNSPVGSDAKVFRVPHKAIFNAVANMLEKVANCHACHIKQGYATFETSNRDGPLLRNSL